MNPQNRIIYKSLGLCIVLSFCSARSFFAADTDNARDIDTMPPLNDGGSSTSASAPAPKEAPSLANNPAMPKVSYVPPPGWKVADEPNSRFKVSTGPPSNFFVPNITISEAVYPGTIKQFVDENVRNMREHEKQFKVISQGKFKSDTGYEGVRLAIELAHPQQNQIRLFRHVYYIFPGREKNSCIIVCCVTTALDGSKYAGLFDQSMDTISIQ